MELRPDVEQLAQKLRNGEDYDDWEKEWRQIPNCPGYFAATDGSIKGPRGKLKPYLSKNGYYMFRPGRNKTNVYVHRAVAEAWIEQTGPVVNHINHIKTDNNVTNLEWCSVQHNVRCSNAVHGHNKAKLTNADKILIIEEYQNGKISQRQLGKKFGVTQRAIFNVLRSAK